MNTEPMIGDMQRLQAGLGDIAALEAWNRVLLMWNGGNVEGAYLPRSLNEHVRENSTQFGP